MQLYTAYLWWEVSGSYFLSAVGTYSVNAQKRCYLKIERKDAAHL